MDSIRCLLKCVPFVIIHVMHQMFNGVLVYFVLIFNLIGGTDIFAPSSICWFDQLINAPLVPHRWVGSVQPISFKFYGVGAVNSGNLGRQKLDWADNNFCIHIYLCTAGLFFGWADFYFIYFYLFYYT